MTKLLTVDEVAQRLRLSKKKVYQLVADNQIPFVKIGGSIRFVDDKIESWIRGDHGNDQIPTD